MWRNDNSSRFSFENILHFREALKLPEINSALKEALHVLGGIIIINIRVATKLTKHTYWFKMLWGFKAALKNIIKQARASRLGELYKIFR